MFRTREISIRSPSAASATLRRNSKLRKKNKKITISKIFLTSENRMAKQLVKKGNHKEHRLLYLWGQHLRSSSDDLRMRSMKDFPRESFEWRGGGFSSIAHSLFRANPCWSSDPQFPNFISTYQYQTSISALFSRWIIKYIRMMAKIEKSTWGKQIGIPPRIAFGGLNIACYQVENRRDKIF